MGDETQNGNDSKASHSAKNREAQAGRAPQPEKVVDGHAQGTAAGWLNHRLIDHHYLLRTAVPLVLAGVLAGLLAGVLLVGIVWWTMFSGRKNGEPPRNDVNEDGADKK